MVSQVAGSTSPQSSFDTSPAKAWSDVQARAKALSARPSVTVNQQGETLTSIAESHHDTLASVEALNPHCPNLLHLGQTVYLPKTTPAQIVPGVDDSQVQPIITALANANAADQAYQATLSSQNPTYIADASAERTASWNAVKQAAYNMLMHNNVNANPDATAAAEVARLNVLESGNANFANATNAALAEAKKTFAQLNYGPIIAAYNQAQQTTASVNSYLQNPRNPHNREVVSSLLGEEQQANDNLTSAIKTAFSNAANQAGLDPNARSAAIDKAASELEEFGPQTGAFRTAVENAKSEYALSVQWAGAGWLPPTDWAAHSPSGSSHPGVDPFNIIISGNSNVSENEFLTGLEAVQDPAGGATVTITGPKGLHVTAPAQWKEVPTESTSGFFNEVGDALNPGTGIEYANVQPNRQGQRVAQQYSFRVGGQQTETDSNINHFRLYKQQLPGGHQALFIAASIESFNGDYFSPYHNLASNGYNQGRDNLLTDIYAAAKLEGWNVQVDPYHGKAVQDPYNHITYDGVTYVVTLTKKNPGAATS